VDVYTIDLKFLDLTETIAAYLVVGPGGPVLVETGPGSTLEAAVGGLAALGFAPADVRHVLVTHIHLDHAGAAGWWARQGAQVYVHHVGAPHLVDPSRLLASAARIYGDAMDALWGEMLPVPAERLTTVADDDRIGVAGLTFTAIDSPGHARHHHIFRLGDAAFTGDATGIRLPRSTFTILPSPPPEFDLKAWEDTLARLRRAQFSRLYPTHFGPIDDVREHLDSFDSLIHAAAGFVRERMEAGVERDALIAQYVEWNRSRAQAQGLSQEEFRRYETANPLFMAVDGLMRYWRKMWEE